MCLFFQCVGVFQLSDIEFHRLVAFNLDSEFQGQSKPKAFYMGCPGQNCGRFSLIIQPLNFLFPAR